MLRLLLLPLCVRLAFASPLDVFLSEDDIDTSSTKELTLEELGEYLKSQGVESPIFSQPEDRLIQMRARSLEKILEGTITSDSSVDENFFDRKQDRIQPEGDSIMDINKGKSISNKMYQGDVLLTGDQVDWLNSDDSSDNTRTRRQAYKSALYPKTIWTGAVSYQFHPSADIGVRTAFRRAASFWRKNTCINIQESSTAQNRIIVYRGMGCYSYIGRVQGVQPLSLGYGCATVGVASHELGHALGFFHTQNRFDRDRYLTILPRNIEPYYADQFDKQPASENSNFGLPYDFGSIMQYGATSASFNGKATMIAKNPKYQYTLGSDMVAFYDVKMMNALYKCAARCPVVRSAKCHNGGFPNPRKCSQCVCPTGYGGLLCNRRPAGCGTILKAGTNFKQLLNHLGDGKEIVRQDFVKCHFLIQAPKGRRVEIQMGSFGGYYLDGCIYGGVEVKSQPDQKKTGYRYCSNADVGTKLFSSARHVPVITFNRYKTSTVQLFYRISRTAADIPRTGNFTNTFDRDSLQEEDIEEDDEPTCVDTRPECEFAPLGGLCEDEETRRECPLSCDQC